MKSELVRKMKKQNKLLQFPGMQASGNFTKFKTNNIEAWTTKLILNVELFEEIHYMNQRLKVYIYIHTLTACMYKSIVTFHSQVRQTVSFSLIQHSLETAKGDYATDI